ncbi:hypothetical protein HRH47_13430 [Enterococcus faecalis]|uniref:hypothetical protein n=1 Tax=Enterococcus faecalis TaxID=1351 RepID=UPI001141AB7E|nr:hypothetical protein [Enterococcus faecalis]NSV63471.1 hypothetical protein [Enterococcus faecalis]NSW12054.1 hypothetical protein [Enterococcus faecalis]TQB25660.1 hypothetical protein FKZ00_13835 [Enterococcus faecalis]
MSEELKTIKELADELGISKKYLQNKISYEKKKQNLSIGNWKKISGKNTIVLSDKEQTLIKSWLNSLEDKQEDKADSLEDKQEDKADSLEDKQEDKADSLEDKQEDKEKSYLKERISVLEKFLDKEQTSNSELKKIIQQTQNLLDQQQRLALQDKKLLEEYKEENDSLKALKMPQEDMKDGSSIRGEAQEEIERLKAQLKLSEEERNKAKEKEPVKTESKKWWQLWK